METDRYEVIFKNDLQHCFREFKPYIDQCYFNGCAHLSDRGCAVIEALQNGEIQKSRHESYCAMYEEAKKIKEWEYHK